MRKRASVSFVFLLTASALLAGCGGSSATNTASTSQGGTTAAKTGGTLNLSLISDPLSLDPASSSAIYDREVFQSLYNKLVDLDAQGNIVPQLADSWDISPDHRMYTFKLHPGVKFTDGTDFNADAVKFNWTRDLDKASTRHNELKEIDKISVVDPLTIQVTLKQPFAPFLSILTDRAGMMVSPTAVQKYGKDFTNHPVGTGPFTLKDWTKGAALTFVKNPNYWQAGLPKLDQVVYKIFTDPNVALNNLKSGQVDIIDNFPPVELGNYQNDPQIQVVNESNQGYQGIHLNVTKPPFDKKATREAVDLLIDRGAIVNVLLHGAGTPAHSPFAPSQFAYDDNDKPPTPDLAKAKALLQQAGLPNGFSFTLDVGTSPDKQQLGLMIQNMLKPAGIDVKIERLDAGALNSKTQTGDFQAMQLQWSGRPDPDQNIYDYDITGGSLNYSRYSNPAVDQILNDARKQTDPTQRKATYDKLMAVLNEEVPYVYLYHAHSLFGVSKKVQGFQYVPDGMIRTVGLSVK